LRATFSRSIFLFSFLRYIHVVKFRLREHTEKKREQTAYGGIRRHMEAYVEAYGADSRFECRLCVCARACVACVCVCVVWCARVYDPKLKLPPPRSFVCNIISEISNGFRYADVCGRVRTYAPKLPPPPRSFVL